MYEWMCGLSNCMICIYDYWLPKFITTSSYRPSHHRDGRATVARSAPGCKMQPMMMMNKSLATAGHLHWACAHGTSGRIYCRRWSSSPKIYLISRPARCLIDAITSVAADVVQLVTAQYETASLIVTRCSGTYCHDEAQLLGASRTDTSCTICELLSSILKHFDADLLQAATT